MKILSLIRHDSFLSYPLRRVCLNDKTATKYSEYNGRHPEQHGYLYVIKNCKRCKYQKVCKFAIKDKKHQLEYLMFPMNYGMEKLWQGKIRIMS